MSKIDEIRSAMVAAMKCRRQRTKSRTFLSALLSEE